MSARPLHGTRLVVGSHACQAKPFVLDETSYVVIDYLWGRPTESLLGAPAKGFQASSTKPTRLVDVGSSAGNTITLPGSALRRIDLKLMGSGFGSVALDRVLAAIPELFTMAAAGKLLLP